MGVPAFVFLSRILGTDYTRTRREVARLLAFLPPFAMDHLRSHCLVRAWRADSRTCVVCSIWPPGSRKKAGASRTAGKPRLDPMGVLLHLLSAINRSAAAGAL